MPEIKYRYTRAIDVLFGFGGEWPDSVRAAYHTVLVTLESIGPHIDDFSADSFARLIERRLVTKLHGRQIVDARWDNKPEDAVQIECAPTLFGLADWIMTTLIPECGSAENHGCAVVRVVINGPQGDTGAAELA